MHRFNFNVDEATLLKTYRISTLHPTKWEEVDYDFEEAIDTVDMQSTERDKDREDPLGLGPARSVKDVDMETKSTVLLTSKTFSPTTYLSFAHPNATYHDLTRGITHLQNSLDAREQALRVLVEEGFDKFVAVKSAVDGLYEDMKVGILASETERATKPLKDYLKNGSQKANQIFIPVLETAAKAQKLRTTLGVFERSKFFFNLPSFIMESIDAGKYEYALRDYKKGKYLLENRPGQLLPISPSSGSNQSPTSPSGNMQQQQQQKRILNKVWASVEKAMGELRKVLVNQLQDPTRGVEEQEKTLETLMELQSNDELVWTYFDSHHQRIMDKMNIEHRNGVKAIENTLRVSSSKIDKNYNGYSHKEGLEFTLQSQLKTAIDNLEAKQADALLKKSAGEPTWHAIIELVKSVSEAISVSLPNFWRISKGFIDGKFQRVNNHSSASRRSPTQCRTMANDIIKLYISLISQTFVLSDVTVMSLSQSSSNSSSSINKLSNNSKDTIDLPPLLPANSHSLSTAYYLQRILSEVQDCSFEISALGISNEMSSALKSLVESLRWRMVDVLVTQWVRDAGIFYHLEKWIASSQAYKPSSPRSSTIPTSTTTQYLEQFEVFQRHLTTAAYKMASVVNGDLPLGKTISSRQGNSAQIPQVLVVKITRGFVDAIYKFLDGLVLLGSDEAPIAKKGAYFEEPTPPSGVSRSDNLELSPAQLLDLKDSNIRLLFVLSNLEYFGKVVIPAMITQLETAFGVSLADDRSTLTSVVEELNKTLFGSYVRPRTLVIKGKIKKAVTGSQMNWVKAPTPTAVRPWVSEVLNYLVETHAQVYDVAPNLVDRTLSALLEELVKETSKSFKTITQFGTGGLLQALMELTFVHKSLGSYGRDTPEGKAFEDIYTKEITKAYSPVPKDKGFQAAFEIMQKALTDARKATGVQYLCFRKTGKESSGKEKKKKERRE